MMSDCQYESILPASVNARVLECKILFILSLTLVPQERHNMLIRLQMLKE
jgi:hypothetical protein